MQNQTSTLVDKGRVVAVVDQYPEKVNGQVVMVQGTNQPKMKNKWMAIGEATKWQHPDGTISVSSKIYLQPVSVNGNFFEQKTFWDSENQNNQATQQGGFQDAQQQYAQQNQNQGGYQNGR